jgi:single-strand DNA-binding protein
MNKVILIGRLTKDPELRYTPGTGIPVATFTLAVNRRFTNAQGDREADFIRIVAWRKLAELCANNLNKGRLAGVCGSLQVRSFDGQDGQRRWITEVVADEVQFLDWPKDGAPRPESGGNFGQDFNDESTDELPF